MPLYMNTVLRIMRSMGVDRFTYSGVFSVLTICDREADSGPLHEEFKRQLASEKLDRVQKAMLKLRLDLLDSFLQPGSPNIQSYFAAGNIVLIDLTDPFLDGRLLSLVTRQSQADAIKARLLDCCSTLYSIHLSAGRRPVARSSVRHFALFIALRFPPDNHKHSPRRSSQIPDVK